MWGGLFIGTSSDGLDIYFLDVGQGDASLVRLPGEVDILIDGGKDKSVLSELARALPDSDRYIDLVILSHTQLDHFGGLIDVLGRYRVGAFIHNGVPANVSAWHDLEKVIYEKGVRSVMVREGDKVTHGQSRLAILGPAKEFLDSKDLNDTSVVVMLSSENSRSLFTADIGFRVEEYLAKKYDLSSDVLKVGHHGSKYSSGSLFLSASIPAVSVISAGKNSYGHPTAEAIKRIKTTGSEVFRTDQDGTVRLNIKDGRAKIYSLK